MMDVAYINPFLIASQEVFQKMVNLDLSLDKPYVKRATETSAAVNSVITLAGPVCGMVILRFSQTVALAAAAGLSGEQHTGLTEECLDALGEITNMIVGSAKKLLPADRPLNMSIPKTTIGSTDLTYPPNQLFLVIPCETSKGRFVIEVGLRKLKEGEVAPRIESAPPRPAPAANVPKGKSTPGKAPADPKARPEKKSDKQAA